MKNIVRKFFLPFVSAVAFLFPSNSEAQSLLWKISGKGLPQESYLFGTIHLIPAKDFFMPRGTDSLLLTSKKLVIEMDISDPTLQMRLMGAMMLDSGKTLASLYTPKEYDYLVKKLEKDYSIPIAMLGNMKPILVQQSLMMKQMMGGDFKSYEKEFMAKVEGKDISIVGLETLEDQLGALNAMSLEEQAKGLLKAVKNPKEGEKSLDKLIEKYKKQDIDGLYNSINGKGEDLKKYEEDLLVNRNKNWIPKIAEMAGKERIFIAVGAAHLGGETGVINLLRKEGYTVEPVLTKN
jgi:uncharacterized protein YbaP (TraB family)